MGRGAARRMDGRTGGLVQIVDLLGLTRTVALVGQMLRRRQFAQ